MAAYMAFSILTRAASGLIHRSLLFTSNVYMAISIFTCTDSYQSLSITSNVCMAFSLFTRADSYKSLSITSNVNMALSLFTRADSGPVYLSQSITSIPTQPSQYFLAS